MLLNNKTLSDLAYGLFYNIEPTPDTAGVTKTMKLESLET